MIPTSESSVPEPSRANPATAPRSTSVPSTSSSEEDDFLREPKPPRSAPRSKKT
jgi:hypothetical protein